MSSSEAIQTMPSTPGSMLTESGFLQRGDAPAQAVLHANAQAMALRKAAETQEELGKINDRVEKTLNSYILADSIERPITGADLAEIKDNYVKDQDATLELVDDLTQLIIILSDPIAKKKYQQQVTIFIVGYENLCGNRMKLLNQLNEFFVQNSKDEDAFDIEYPDFDIEEVGKTVRTALDKAEKAQDRLNVVSKGIVKVLETVSPKEAKSRKKKLEKAIIQSRDDIIQLTEKLSSVQKDLENNEGKLSQLYKTLEGKQMEIEKLKGHVEMSKRKAQELDELKAEMEIKNATLVKTRQEMDKVKLLLAHAEDKSEHASNRQKESREMQQRMKSDLEEKIKEQQQKVVEIRQAMETQHDQELKSLRDSYQTEVSDLKSQYEEEISVLKQTIAKIENERDAAEKERAELQRFTTSFFNEDDQSRSGTKISWKTSATAMRLATKKSQTLGTDSTPGTPRRALKTDGTVSSLKSSDTPIRMDRSNTENVSFLPGTPAAPTPMTPATPAGPQTPAKVQKGDSSLTGTPGTPATPADRMPPSREKPLGSRGKKRNGKAAKSKSQRASRVALSTHEESGSTFVEMIDEAIQTEVAIPEKSDLDKETEAVVRKMSLALIPEDEIKDFNEMDENVNWDDYPIQELPARFAHYRKMSEKKATEMQEELMELKQKYNNKVQALKGMMDLRSNWNNEREELIRQLETGTMMKEEAEQEAELAMLQVEELMAEQEEMRLEIQMKTLALKEVQTMTSPLQTANSVNEIGVGTEQADEQPTDNQQDEQPIESEEKEESDAPSSSRPTTIPTIIQTDDYTTEVLHSTERDYFSPPELPERIMSARARTRLVNSALSRHPVAQETVRNYKNLIEFKNSIADVLSREELEDEAAMLNDCEVVQLDEADGLAVLEKIAAIRSSSSEILDCLSDIIPSLLSTEDILFNSLENPVDGGFADSRRSSLQNKLESIAELTEPVEVTTDMAQSLAPNSAKSASSKGKCEEGDGVEGQESDGKGQESDDQTKQSEVKTLSEPSKSGLRLSSAESGERTGGGKRLNAKEGRKKLVADYRELINRHQGLTEEFEALKRDMKIKDTSYEEQLTQNAQVMQDMQSAINSLNERLQSYEITHPLTVKASQISSPDFMFTRLDMEHNAKALKRGLQNGRITYDGYKEMVDKMEEYVTIPIKRLARMARKYLHHARMKEVESAIRMSRSLDGEVYSLLDKMEVLQEKRTMRWEERMGELAGQREHIAKLLVKTLEMIEHETGIFLIKPIMSVPSKRRIGSGYIVSRREKSPKGDVPRQQSSGFLAPNTTPSPRAKVMSKPSIQGTQRLDSGSLKLNVKSMMADSSGDEGTWKIQSSFNGPLETDKHLPHIPKIMELDINRSMFANNQVSTKLTTDVNGNTGPLHSNVLSYITVTRPSGEITKRTSVRGLDSVTTANVNSPPPSPYDQNGEVFHIRKSHHHDPLPPIRSSSRGENHDDGRSVSTYLSDAERHWSPVLAQEGT